MSANEEPYNEHTNLEFDSENDLSEEGKGTREGKEVEVGSVVSVIVGNGSSVVVVPFVLVGVGVGLVGVGITVFLLTEGSLFSFLIETREAIREIATKKITKNTHMIFRVLPFIPLYLVVQYL